MWISKGDFGGGLAADPARKVGRLDIAKHTQAGTAIPRITTNIYWNAVKLCQSVDVVKGFNLTLVRHQLNHYM